MPKIVAIAGSPAHPSRSYFVLEHIQQILQSVQSTGDREALSYQIISVRDVTPEALLFAQFDHADIRETVAAIESADAIIISTPVYKAAYAGVLKALLDLLPQNALVGKPVLPIATGGTIAHLLSIDYALKPVLSALGARHILAGVYIVDTQVQKQDDHSYQLVDSEIEDRLKASVNELVAAIPETPMLVGAGR